MSTAVQPLTAEEFAALPGSRHQELVRGEVVQIMPPGGVHGKVAVSVVMFLGFWARQGSGGIVGVESGFILERDPDLVRGPDAYYVRTERIPAGGIPEGFWPIAPDLAVEVVSPNDTAGEVRAKVREYLAAGTAAVWVVYPSTREVIAHTPDGMARTYGPGETLEMPELLPGFSLAISELFG
ncbi:Uma2 family endonuclease [Chloroflexales bacterium ZM16-3]|nr:Uma2 family endonuclease [Chloroflexales bacterium ZM16-3]